MAIITTSRYTLKRFSSSSESGFTNALALYIKHTHPSVRTNSNEISYWADNSARYHPNILFLFGFYCENSLIGFSEIAYLSRCKVLAVDYLVIDPAYRKNNVFFEFIEHIKTFIANIRLDVLYVTAEVAKYGHQVPPDYSRLIIRLLKFSGFRVAKAAYWQPALGEKNAESLMEAVLMIFPYGDIEVSDRQVKITKETFLQIIGSLYFDHYLKWYMPHVHNLVAYKIKLVELLNIVEKNIKNDFVELNGQQWLQNSGEAQTTSEQKTALYYGGIGLVMVLIISLILIGTSTTALIQSGSIILIYLSVLLSFVAIIAAIKESPSAIIKNIVDVIKAVFRIDK